MQGRRPTIIESGSSSSSSSSSIPSRGEVSYDEEENSPSPSPPPRRRSTTQRRRVETPEPSPPPRRRNVEVPAAPQRGAPRRRIISPPVSPQRSPAVPQRSPSPSNSAMEIAVTGPFDKLTSDVEYLSRTLSNLERRQTEFEREVITQVRRLDANDLILADTLVINQIPLTLNNGSLYAPLVNQFDVERIGWANIQIVPITTPEYREFLLVRGSFPFASGLSGIKMRPFSQRDTLYLLRTPGQDVYVTYGKLRSDGFEF